MAFPNRCRTFLLPEIEDFQDILPVVDGARSMVKAFDGEALVEVDFGMNEGTERSDFSFGQGIE